MAKEAAQQLRAASEPLPFAAHGDLDILDGVGREIREHRDPKLAAECPGQRPERIGRAFEREPSATTHTKERELSPMSIAEPEPENTPTRLNLTPEEIACLEEERTALSARLAANIPSAPPAAVEPVAEVDELGAVAEIADEPTGTANMGRPRSVEIETLLATLHEEYATTMEAAGLAFDARVRELVKEQQEAAAEEARAVKPQLTKQLKAVLAELRAASVGEDGVSASDAAWFARLDARVNAALARAATVEKSLKQFQKAHGAELEQLAAIDRREWLAGVPTATSRQQEGALAAVAQVQHQIEIVRALLAGSLQNIDKQRAEIIALVTRARGFQGPWPIPPTTRDGREQSMVQALHEVAMASPDTVATLNDMLEHITHAVAKINAAKRAARADGSVAQPIQFEASYQRTLDAKAELKLEDGGRADLAWSPFDRGDSDLRRSLRGEEA